MGAGRGENGHIYLVDNDCIEMSNLTRYFSILKSFEVNHVKYIDNGYSQGRM